MLTTTPTKRHHFRLKNRKLSQNRSASLIEQSSARLSPAEFYCQHISVLPGVEVILQDSQPDVTHFTTVLARRDIEMREKIYAVEMEMFEAYPNIPLTFSVSYLATPQDSSSVLKQRSILFQRQPDYGK